MYKCVVPRSVPLPKAEIPMHFHSDEEKVVEDVEVNPPGRVQLGVTEERMRLGLAESVDGVVVSERFQGSLARTERTASFCGQRLSRRGAPAQLSGSRRDL